MINDNTSESESKDTNDEEDSDEKENALEKKLFIKKDFAWENWDDDVKGLCRDFSKDYIFYLANAQTERERVEFFSEIAEALGFKKVEIGDALNLQPGDKVYFENRHKNLALIHIGKKTVEGMRIIGTHLDTPRLDLKIRPFYEEKQAGLTLLKTHYYGGIKKIGWTTIPLNLTGVVVKKDGTRVKINIGKNPEDPVFSVPDILIHLSRTIQSKRTTYEAIKGEELNAVVGSLPIEKDKAKKATQKFKLNILNIINEKYDIVEEDFESAELSLVSGVKPRYVGLDKGMIGGAGQDDGICSYTAFHAIKDLNETPEYTSIIALLDKEETGSNGPTGAQSSWLKFVINSILPKSQQNLSTLHKTLTNIKMISGDVTGGMNPIFKSVHDLKNAAFIGKGIAVDKYGGSGGKSNTNDATAEFMAFMRKTFSDADVPYQIAKLGAVDVGGGGTIAKFFAQQFNCDVVDAGTPLLNMHSPYELASIVDLYSTYLAYSAFLKSN